MSDEDRAADIAADCRERRERGEAIDTDEVVREHPGLELPLRAAFAAWRRLDEQFDVARGAPSRIGRTLGPYRLVEELGAGGMGTVYLAESGNERVAVKVLHPHLCGRQGFLQRLLREADLGRRVRHANVVRTLEAATADCGAERLHFVVMEHVAGRTLRALLDDLGRVPEELCRHIGLEVAKALDAIHAAGAIHRDLKPENVIITPEQAVKVMDLGVARLLDESMRVSQSGAFVGSVRYAAPEQFGFRRATGAEEAIPRSPVRAKGDPVDGRADLYALGLTLYELATGTHPFAGDEFHVVLRKQMDDVPRPAGELNPQLSPYFEELLARLVEKDRANRIASAADLVRILDEGEESAWWRERSASIRAATRRPLRRIRVPRETALYGRDKEMALLRSLYERAAAGDGQVLLIEGEAGIGKSRLVDEFVGSSCGDLNFLYGSYPPGGAATASGAFSVAYREHLGDDEAAIRDALPQTPLLVPAFAALLSGDAAPAGAEPLTKDSLQTVFVHATRSIAATRPTIVLIDDLHFAPEEGRALFASLALAVPGHRILLVGCARPSLDGQWVAQLAGHEHATRLALPRLGPKELVHLLRDALKSERLAEELAALIAVKSDGNPFFVFELLRGLRDGQFLRQRADGTWETTQIIRDIQVPSSIAELVQARVADLEADDKNLLDAAACCGFEFDPLVVAAALGGGEIAVLQRLARVEQRHRLVRSAGRRFVFDHHQVQEALYGGLPELLRERYHAAIAEAIETRTGAETREPNQMDGAVCWDLAEHLLRGARGARALRYLDAALSHLEKRYLNDAAVALARRALMVPGLVAGTARCLLLLRTASRLDYLARRREQETALDEAMRIADETGDRSLSSRARYSLGWLFHVVGREAESETMLGQAIEHARAAGDREIEGAALGHIGNVIGARGRYPEAAAAFERRIALARETGDRHGELVAVGNLGGILRMLGRPAEAQVNAERWLTYSHEIGDRRNAIVAQTNLADVLADTGRYKDAIAAYESVLGAAREIGARWLESIAMCNISGVLSSMGRHADAREMKQNHLRLAAETGDRRGAAISTGNMGTSFFCTGELAESLRYSELHLKASREMGFPYGETIALVNLGLVHLALGDTVSAEIALNSSLEISRHVGERRVEAFGIHRLGMLAVELGDADAAALRFGEAIDLRREIGARGDIAESLVERGSIFCDRGDVSAAIAHLAEARELATAAGTPHTKVLAECYLALLQAGDAGDAARALAANERRLDHFSLMLARHLLWRVTRDRSQHLEAKRLLEHLVAHAPPESRESMICNVRLHREIAEAARGLPAAARDAS